MAKWKLMTKKIGVIAITAAMMIGSSMTAFAQSSENVQASQTTKATSKTASETTNSTDNQVLEETNKKEEESEEGIDRSNAISVPGNGQVLDDIKDDGSTKEFLTIVTKNNQTFYVVIDRSSTTDNVYMLSNIDETDLQEFLKESGTDTKEESAPAVILPEKEVTDEAADETESKDTKEEETKKDPASNAGMGIIFLAALGALAAAYYFKIYKPKKNVEVDTGNEGLENMEDYDEVDEDEE